MMNRFAVILVVFVLVVAACSSPSDDPTAAAPDGPVCVEPPASELAAQSPLRLTVEPNPIDAGAKATLSIEPIGTDTDPVTGAGAAWQCWNGSGWVDTHQIVKGFDGGDGRTIEVQPGATTTIPAVGLTLPGSYPIVIPDVPPGTYRIVDEIFEGGTIIEGFVFVTVTSAGS